MVVLVCDLNHYHFKWHKQDFSHESQMFTILKKSILPFVIFFKSMFLNMCLRNVCGTCMFILDIKRVIAKFYWENVR